MSSKLAILDSFKVRVCVECLIGKQKKPILFKDTEPSSIPYRFKGSGSAVTRASVSDRGRVSEV